MIGYDKYIELKKELNIDNIVKEIQNKNLTYNDEIDLIWKKCIRDIVSYFIMDVSENSLNNIYNTNKEDAILNDKTKNRKYIIKKLITFSECAETLHKSIELFIENRIINSYEVNCFDGKGEYILRQLFKAYYENPKQMPQSELRILEKMIQKNSGKYGELKINKISLSNIKFIPSSFEDTFDFDDVEKLIKALKLETNEFKRRVLKINNITECKDEVIINLLNKNLNDEHLDIDMKHYLENHYAYLYVISNYISKMTDNYAEKEYTKLYLKN